MSKLLPNLPIEDLTAENDYLGIIDKGDIIKTFLESNTEEFSQIKMFSLYGEWGSGKSTLMKYLQKELKGSFNTFFFESWEFESDSNLSLSLLEYLIKESQDSTEEAFGEIVEVAEKLFKGFAKAITIKTPIININGKEIIQSFQKEKSFLKLKNEFKTEFIRWEDLVTKGENPKYNIVFIDDLDRCEPENVLNLLSALKLFFTYGKKTVFFCGIDKKAVNEAVKTKYGKVVKANEYLEKIFDISFSMPDHDDIFKLVNQYFDTLKVESSNNLLSDKICGFFKQLNFTNPRRIKKVLNKFLILKSIRRGLINNHSCLKSIPSFIDETGGNYFETIIVLYFIITLEFEPKALACIFNLKEKQLKYYNDIKSNGNLNNLPNYSDILNMLINSDLINKPLSVFNSSNNYESLVFTFLPIEVDVPNPHIFKNNAFSKIRVKKNILEFQFVKYLIDNIWMFSSVNEFSECSLYEIKDIIKKML